MPKKPIEKPKDYKIEHKKGSFYVYETSSGYKFIGNYATECLAKSKIEQRKTLEKSFAPVKKLTQAEVNEFFGKQTYPKRDRLPRREEQ